MLQTIHDAISEALKTRALDWRTCFSQVLAVPPEGRLVVECSNPAVLEDVRRRLSDWETVGERGVEFVALPDVRAVFPDVVVASSSVADVRRAPSHAAELVTQIVCGDAVTPLKEEGDWVLARLDDGYVGWVRAWHLKGLSSAEAQAFERRARHRIRDNVVQIYETPDESALPVSDAVVGTPVAVEPSPKRGWRRISLPDGKQGYARARVIEKRRTPSRVSRTSLAATGLHFIGIPYLWGGTTPKGFDCSGLVQRVFRLHGQLIPRDSDMQGRFGHEKIGRRAADLETGDLLFFGKSPAQITHVAMYLSNGLFLHAYGHVRVNALLPAHPLFEERLVSDWQFTRDPLST